MKQLLKNTFNMLGCDIVSYPHFVDKRRLAELERYDIRTIVDIGANEGQYATYMRKIGFGGTILSFEPVRATFNKLDSRQLKGGQWVKKNLAVGSREENAVIHVTENTLSSSLLVPLTGLLESTPEAKVVSEETVRVTTLDSCWNELKEFPGKYFLKLDAQGFERKILEGAKESIRHFSGLQIEASMKKLYDGEDTFFELLPFIESFGFKLHKIENGYCNPQTGEVLQVELILFRDL